MGKKSIYGAHFQLLMYEPEQFPAIIFRVPNTCSVLIFASGKGILAGAKTIEDLNAAMFELKKYLKDLL